MTTNRYPTHCITCQAQVPAHHGQAFRHDGRWICDCATTPTTPTPFRCECGRPACRGCDDAYDAWKDEHTSAGTWGRPGHRPRYPY